jgi:hypothetical protein
MDSIIPISLEGNQKEMDEFDRSAVISLSDVFNQERQESSIFRLTSNIDFLFFNAYWGISPYDKFRDQFYYLDSESSFVSGIWSGFPQYKEFDMIRVDNDTPNYTTNPNPHVDFKNINSTNYNWSFYVSYPYINDETKRLQYYTPNGSLITWFAADGIPFYVQSPYVFNGQSLVSLVCGVKHNFKSGEYVEISIGPLTLREQIISLGNEGYDSDKYIINLYLSNLNTAQSNQFGNSVTGTLKRIADINNPIESISKYYVRKHRIITNYDDAILVKAGFQNNAFGNQRKFEFSSLTPNSLSRVVEKHGMQSYNLTFKKDFDISKYRDNLKRPITELFITIINRGYFGWFNPPILNGRSLKEGYYHNLTNNISPYWDNGNSSINLSNIQTNSFTTTQGASTFTFYHNQFLKIDDVINGDFCEFNQVEQQEYVLSEYYHKLSFNPLVFQQPQNITSSTNPPGYYYKPHYKIELRTYSDYIEEGDVDEIADAPDYAFYSDLKGVLVWRDIYTYGFKDNNGRGVDHPFLNGAHYPTSKVIFRLKPEGNTSDNITTIAEPKTDDCE